MYYLKVKEVVQMALSGVDLGADLVGSSQFIKGIAIVVVIILLLVAMGIAF